MRRRGWRVSALAGAGLLVTTVVAGSATWADAATSGTVSQSSLLTPDSTPLGLAADARGGVWFAEHGGSSVGQVDSAGRVYEYPVAANSQKGLGVLDGMATGRDGMVWFTDASSVVPRVGHLDPATGKSTLYELPTGGAADFTGGQVIDITAGPDGAMWFAANAAGAVGRIDSSGAVTAYPTVGQAPYAITTGPDKALWFTDTSSGSIGRLAPATGTVKAYSPPSSGAGSPATGGITTGPDKAMWFTETGVGKIGRLDPVTGAITEYTVPTANAAPEGIVSGPDGAVWFTEAAAGNIGRIDPASGAVTEYPLPSALSAPMRIINGPGGALWISETGINTIGRLNPAAPPSGSPHPAAPPLIAGTWPLVAAHFQGQCPKSGLLCETQVTTGGRVKIGTFSQQLPSGAIRVTGYATSFTNGTAVLKPPLTGPELASLPVVVPGGIIAQFPLIGPILGLTPVGMLPFNKLTTTESLAGPVTIGFGPGGLRATAQLNIHLNNTLLGPSCVIGPITATLAPHDLTGGSIHDPELGWQPLTVHIEDTTFTVPTAHGCGTLGLLDGVINSTMGLPSPAGNNTLDLPAILSIGPGASSTTTTVSARASAPPQLTRLLYPSGKEPATTPTH
jgi:streptogramin lyase